MKVLFILDSVRDLKFPWDTTSFLAAECQRRGWALFLCEPRHLFWQGNHPWAGCRGAQINPKKGIRLKSKTTTLSLNQFQFVWMRKDPPVDHHYIQTCQLLARVAPPTVVINNPIALIEKNEKLFALEFPQWSPRTCVARSSSKLHAFLKKEQKVVIKPLNQRGSIGVKLIQSQHFGPQKGWLELTENESTYILAQHYLPAAMIHGNKRILLIDGEPIGAFIRPPTPDTLTGKTLAYVSDLPTTLTSKEKKLCQVLAPALKKLGLFFVGIDVIAEKLIEINITSPAGVPEMNKLYGGAFEKKIVDLLCRKFLRGKR